MGLLSVGTPLEWEETKKWAAHVKKNGILQFIHLYHKIKDRTNDVLKWGDEIEYSLVYLDHENKSARLLLKAEEMLEVLQREENENPGRNKTAYRMEYAEYMVEGTPGQPFGGCMRHFNSVEANMRLRRQEIHSLLNRPGETMICYAAFPRIGCPAFTEPIYPANPQHNKITRSLYYPDEAITQSHPRFANLSRNIRHRRGRKQIINIPVFKDQNTPDPFLTELPNDDGEGEVASLPDHVYLDCMGFGMGCSCLQVTFQACNIEEATVLYDQLAVLAPIMLSLSAASPAFRGTLVDLDCRWSIISGSVDDRTKQELGEVPLMDDKFVLRKSRYDCIDMYISEAGAKYNDIPILYEQEHLDLMLQAGIEPLLAEHIAHLFVRDPISVFKEKLHQDNENDTDHFENIQSTNWQSIRFKPPPPNSTIGWRVEFRSMEVQLTDFENAAYVVFIVLLTRVILSFKLDLIIPISKVEENMKRAIKRNSVHDEKFWFRKEPQSCCDGKKCENIEDEYVEMTVDTIINGKDGVFPGLVPLMENYIDSVDVDIDTTCTISQYLKLIQDRASGKLITMATWMRKFVHEHPKYEFDSVINEEIAYDLSVTADAISRGEIGCPELFAVPETKTSAILPENCHKMEKETELLIKKATEKQKMLMQSQGVHLINGNANGVNGSANGVNGNAKMVNGSANGVNGNAKMVNGSANGVNGNAEMVNRSANGVNGKAKMVNGNANGVNGNGYGINGNSYGVNVSADQADGNVSGTKITASAIKAKANGINDSVFWC